MASFIVHGPFEIDFELRNGGRALVFDGGPAPARPSS